MKSLTIIIGYKMARNYFPGNIARIFMTAFQNIAFWQLYSILFEIYSL